VLTTRLPVVLLLVFGGWSVQELAPVSAQDPRAAQPAPQAERGDFEVLTKGIVASRPFEARFTAIPIRLSFRNLVMGRGETQGLKFDARVLMELRQGGVVTTVNQQKTERRAGDFWVVERGVSIAIQNPNEVAVIRAIYMFAGSQ
jgi:hypothetical protein